jgi:predicted lipoprotein with Yx(FWY)xxD motif
MSAAHRHAILQREYDMKLSSVLLGAAAIGLLSTSFALADDYLGGVVKSANVGGKEILTDSKGMTLYIWDKDTAGVSNCYDKCAAAWPPVLVDASTKVDGDFTLVDRKDSDKKIVAYKGMPLYLWVKDTKPGDTTGDGVGGTWHTAVE